MAKFRLARAAERDLEDITEFIARDSVDAAVRVPDKLERAFLELADMPGLGHRREDLTSEDFRFWPVYDYPIVYDSSTNPLAVVRACTAGETWAVNSTRSRRIVVA